MLPPRAAGASMRGVFHMGSFFDLTILDFGGEKTVSKFQGISIGAVNFDAQVILQDALETAVNALTIGTINKRRRIASEATVSSTLPAEAAQREQKWLVMYHDNVTGKKYHMEIGCADTALLAANSEQMDHTLGAYTAFVTAFEGYVKQGEVVDNAVIVDDVILVHRNT